MEAALIILSHVEIYICLGPFSLCCSTVRSAVDSRLGTFRSTRYEACRANMMSLRGDNNANV